MERGRERECWKFKYYAKIREGGRTRERARERKKNTRGKDGLGLSNVKMSVFAMEIMLYFKGKQTILILQAFDV